MPFWRPRGCVLWLDFLEPSGSVAYDKSGYGNHGTIHGAQRVRSLGRWGLEFDGVDDYVELPDGAVKNLTDEFTIETFVLWKGLGPEQSRGRVFAERGAKSIRFATDAIEWVGEVDGEYGWQIVSYAPPTGRWLHIALTYSTSAGHGKTFVDGELLDVKNVTGPVRPVSPYETTIGTDALATTAWFYGTIALIRIYNRALSEREIKASYAYFFSHLKGEV